MFGVVGCGFGAGGGVSWVGGSWGRGERGEGRKGRGEKGERRKGRRDGCVWTATGGRGWRTHSKKALFFSVKSAMFGYVYSRNVIL